MSPVTPHVGLVGLTSIDEASFAFDCFLSESTKIPFRHLGIGVLVGLGYEEEPEGRFVPFHLVKDIFPPGLQLFNLVHFHRGNGNPKKNMLNVLCRLEEIAGSDCRGFQLDSWPEPAFVRAYRDASSVGKDQKRVFLKIGDKEVEAAGGTPGDVRKRLKYYRGDIDGVSFDFGNGRGNSFDEGKAFKYVAEAAAVDGNWGLGITGLTSKTFQLVEKILYDFPDLSLDMELLPTDGKKEIEEYFSGVAEMMNQVNAPSKPVV